MNRHLLFLVLIVLAACSKDEKKSPSVFFAGEIVNPTNRYVVLYKGDVVIDSAQLDDANRFVIQLDSVSEGLHHFNTSREFQYLFLENGDSVQVRLNTIDFDESLVFSGTTSSTEINNFLMDLFLSNEEEERAIFKNGYELEPKEFAIYIDSLRLQKLEDLNKLASESELSDGAKEIARASIDYTYFRYKEEYPFEHRKHGGIKVIQHLPSGFYDYRKGISFENGHLNYLRPYYDFMQAHFKNLSFSNCSKYCEINNDVVRNPLHFNRHKLSLIDSLVQEKELKDNLFRNVAINYLLMSRDSEKNIESFIEDFHSRSPNNRHIKEIDDLFVGIQNMQPQKKVPDLMVTAINGDSASLQEISKDKKVVFYFWTAANRAHFENVVKRAKQLSEIKKDYDFVGINIRTDDVTWKGMVEAAGLDKQNQYKADDFNEIQRILIIDKLNKCIIAEDAIIVDAFSDMYASSLMN